MSHLTWALLGDAGNNYIARWMPSLTGPPTAARQTETHKPNGCGSRVVRDAGAFGGGRSRNAGCTSDPGDGIGVQDRPLGNVAGATSRHRGSEYPARTHDKHETKERTDMPYHDQSVDGAHGLCWQDGHQNGSTWWWDVGVVCEHPEWHEK